jgi:hypothetical protein
MATEPKRPNGPKIEFDALAEKVVPDPAAIPDSIALSGFVGRSAEDGKIRLYVDASFRSYYEISIPDIVHSQQVPATQSTLGGSVVYVKGSDRLQRVQVSTEIEARFLQGPMSSAAAGAAGASSLPGANRAFGGLPIFTHFRPYCISSAPTSCADLCSLPPTVPILFCDKGGGDTSAFDC